MTTKTTITTLEMPMDVSTDMLQFGNISEDTVVVQSSSQSSYCNAVNDSDMMTTTNTTSSKFDMQMLTIQQQQQNCDEDTDATVYQKQTTTIQLPDWIDDKYLNKYSIYYNQTYRSILSIFFDNRKTIYRTVEYKKYGYFTHSNSTSFSFANRTTYLLSLIEFMDCEKIRFILKLFLTYAKDVNFFHPTKDINALIILKRKLLESALPDVLDLLLARKEICIPDVIIYISDCIYETRHMYIILNSFQNFHHTTKHIDMFSSLLKNYMENNIEPSRFIMMKFLKLVNMDILELNRLFLRPNGFNTMCLQFISLVDWCNMQAYDYNKFRRYIQNIFNSEMYYHTNPHGLLQLYMNIVIPYKMNVRPTDRIVQKIIFKYKDYPVFILLAEHLKCLSKYIHLLPQDLPVIKFLNNRYKIRYGKYFYYWRHKTYCPGSKYYHSLSDKYNQVMPNNNVDKFNDISIESPPDPNLEDLCHIIINNPYANKKI